MIWRSAIRRGGPFVGFDHTGFHTLVFYILDNTYETQNTESLVNLSNPACVIASLVSVGLAIWFMNGTRMFELKEQTIYLANILQILFIIL